MKDGVMFIDIPETCEKCRFRGVDEFKCEEGIILEGVKTAEERAGRCPIEHFDLDWCVRWSERFLEVLEKPQQVVRTPKKTKKLKRKKTG